MTFYETIGAQVDQRVPRQTAGLDAAGIVAYCMAHFKTTGEPGTSKPANKVTAYMIAVGDAIFDPANWKNPVKAEMPKIPHAWVQAAIIWYHGAEPIDTGWVVYSRGYACG